VASRSQQGRARSVDARPFHFLLLKRADFRVNGTTDSAVAQMTWTREAQVWLRDIYDFIIDILGVFHGALPIERYLL